jgi:hypothetical protein
VRYLILTFILIQLFAVSDFPEGSGQVSERALAIRFATQQQGQSRIERYPRR